MQASSSSSADAVDKFIVLSICSKSCSGGFSAFISVQAKPHSKPPSLTGTDNERYQNAGNEHTDCIGPAKQVVCNWAMGEP